MPVWRIHAVAGPDDPRWQGRKIWKDVVVRAPTAAAARLLASDLDRPAETRISDARNVRDWSGFNDEKLYWVQRLNSEHAARFGLAGDSDQVITAILLNDHINLLETDERMPRNA